LKICVVGWLRETNHIRQREPRTSNTSVLYVYWCNDGPMTTYAWKGHEGCVGSPYWGLRGVAYGVTPNGSIFCKRILTHSECLQNILHDIPFEHGSMCLNQISKVFDPQPLFLDFQRFLTQVELCGEIPESVRSGGGMDIATYNQNKTYHRSSPAFLDPPRTSLIATDQPYCNVSSCRTNYIWLLVLLMCHKYFSFWEATCPSSSRLASTSVLVWMRYVKFFDN